MAKLLRNTVTGEVYPINPDLMRRGDMVEFDPEKEKVEAEPEVVVVTETVAAVEPAAHEVPEESNAPADEFASLGPLPDDLGELDLEL